MSSEDSFDYLPYFTEGKVVVGFGRGGAELGIPTANFPDDVIRQLPDEFVCGVYYGWACVNTLSPAVYKMVMCCGWNSHFHNTMKTMETHIMHKFDEQFYGENLRIIILGYIRPMEAYDSLDALIQAVNGDINRADAALSQPAMMEFKQHAFLTKATTATTTTAATTACENGHVSGSTSSTSSTSTPTPTHQPNSDQSHKCTGDDAAVPSETADHQIKITDKKNGSSESESCTNGECKNNSRVNTNNCNGSSHSNSNSIDNEQNKSCCSNNDGDSNIQQTIKHGDSQQHHSNSKNIVIENGLNKL